MINLLKRKDVMPFAPLKYLCRVTWDNHIMNAVMGAVMFTTFGMYYAHSVVQVRAEESSRAIERKPVVRRKTKEDKRREDFARQRMAEVERYSAFINPQIAY